jgi:hypothetical protein
LNVTTSRRLGSTAVACTLLFASACSGGGGDGGEDASPPAPDGATATATATVVNDAVAEAADGDPPTGDEATTYAEVAADNLRDFARDDLTTDDARAEGEHVTIGSGPASRFLALGMASDDGRARIDEAHAATALALVASGVADDRAGGTSDWEAQVGKLDAIVAAGEVLERGADAGQAQAIVADAKQVEDRTIVAGHLVAALRSEAAGDVDPDTQAVLDVAEATIPPTSLAEIRDRVGDATGDMVPVDLALDVHDAYRDDLAAFVESFAGREDYPVERTMFAVYEARDLHFQAAVDGRDED